MVVPLPNQGYVTLSEALTWVAFARPLDRAALNKELAGPAFGVGIATAKLRLGKALASIMDAAAAGKVDMTGKRLPSHQSDPDGYKTVTIPAIDCQNYRQFDLTIDGLRFGVGLAWLPDQSNSWDYGTPKRPEFFTQVAVRRSSLMHTFSARVQNLPANAQSKLPALPQADLDAWWANLTPDERGQSRETLGELCAAQHPKHTISRRRMRALTPNRKRGPQSKKPK
ncbi:MAG: hypothetical protein RIT17_287 [Pseudomonadota bacterium]|jgi:hypothetical protein